MASNPAAASSGVGMRGNMRYPAGNLPAPGLKPCSAKGFKLLLLEKVKSKLQERSCWVQGGEAASRQGQGAGLQTTAAL